MQLTIIYTCYIKYPVYEVYKYFDESVHFLKIREKKKEKMANNVRHGV